MNKITQNATYEQNISKSKFIGFTFYVENEIQANEIIKKLKNKFCDCRHLVYAYKIYPDIEKKENSSEPAGTAGAPILSAIIKNDLTNILIVVVRYFGGVLLGASNLYRAYSSTALETIALSNMISIEKYKVFAFNCDYTTYSRIVDISQKDVSLKVLAANFENSVDVRLAVKEDNLSILKTFNIAQSSFVEEIWL